MDLPARTKPLVAVIDHDETLLTLLRELVDDWGWELLPLPDGAVALEQVRRCQPHVILLDICLRGTVTGWRLLDDLMSEHQTRTIPIVVWSGAADQLRDREDWLAEQSIPVLAKPFEIDGLHDILALAMHSAARRTPAQ